MSHRGTLEQFDQIVLELQRNIKAYEDKKIKHYAFADTNDNIFANYNWSKVEFYKELNARLGIQTNESRDEQKKQLDKFKKKITKR